MRTDGELVNAVLDGGKQAFCVLVNRYERPVRAVALNVLGDHHLAKDVTQDAFLRAYERLAGLRKPEAFGGWLMKIARRCALESVRRKPKEARLDTEVATAAESPNGQLDAGKQELLAAVVKLPKAEMQVVMLRYFGGNSVKEVATVVDRSVGTVTKQLSRAHKRLRYLLEGS